MIESGLVLCQVRFEVRFTHFLFHHLLIKNMRQIDHIVYTVPNLEAAMDWFEKLSGIRPAFGGYHTTQGTKNAVVNLGNSRYLEILAADEANKNIQPPRWMGVDFLEKAQMTRWSLKSNDLPTDSAILKQYQQEMGRIQGGQRKMTNGNLLTWEMIMPLAAPQVEVLPFMTDWQHSAVHPTDAMPEQCELISMAFTHPAPHLLLPIFDKLKLDFRIEKGRIISINAKISCPKGIIEI